MVRAFYPDPADKSGKLGMVDIKPVMPAAKPVTLAAMKATPELAGMSLLRQSRLSVCPVADHEWARHLPDGRHRRLSRLQRASCRRRLRLQPRP